MDALSRLRICALAAVSLGAATTSAHAQEGHGVRWEGACGAEGAGLSEEIVALVGSVPSAEQLEVSVRVEGEAVHRLSLALHRAGVTVGERVFEGRDCAELVGAAALVVALAIDPRALETTVDDTPHGDSALVRPTPMGADTLAPPPQRSASSARPSRAASSAESILRARRRPRAPAREEAPSAPNDGGVASSRSLDVSVGVALVLDVGALPNAAPGVEGRVGLGLGPLRLEGAARVFFEQESGLGQHPTGRGHFGMAAGSLGACLPLEYGAVSLGPCLGLEAGAIWGASTGVTSPGADTSPWVAPWALGLLAVDLTRWLRLRLDLGVTIPVVRTEFVVDGLGPVHAPTALTFRGGVGAEVHFR